MLIKVRVDERYRIVIPKEVRRQLDIKPNSEVLIELRGNEAVLRPLKHDPFEELGKLLGDFRFTREDRRRAERWFLSELKPES